MANMGLTTAANRPRKVRLYEAAALAREQAQASNDPVIRQAFERAAKLFTDAAAGAADAPDRATVYAGGRQ
jgi:hypothetical protein